MEDSGSVFPDTSWGVVCAVRLRDPSERRAGLETLCRRYGGPIQHFLRAAFRLGLEEARDLTQDFFLWLLEGDVLARYAPELGSFRAYLRGLLRNYGRNAMRAERRQKRGGGARALPLEAAAGAGGPDPDLEEAERAFDRAWVLDLTGRAIERLRVACARANDPRQALRWAVFEAYDLAPEEARPTYAALAERHGIGEKDVSNHLQAMRERLRREVRAELADTVASPRDLEEEWRAFLG